jgi:hypothetical protein
MWKAALVGAVALAAIGTTTVATVTPAAAESIVVTSAQIGQLKGMLRLTPAQERYWPPVEAALRSLARQSAAEDDNDGFVQKVRSRASAMASNAAGIRRAWAAARPLIRVLDDEQKQSVMGLARSLGIGHLASAL